MFDGNVNDDDVVTNTLEYPIVARYIRINPQRWARFISLRVELYGCRFGKLWNRIAAADDDFYLFIILYYIIFIYYSNNR